MEKDDLILITGGSGFIGTNLQELLLSKNINFLNLDIHPPTNVAHTPHWKKGDIMDPNSLSDIFNTYKPTVIVHLAARTDTASAVLEDYKVNYEGTDFLVREIQKHPSIKRAVFASTQYVYKDCANPFPISDDSYKPHTVYGLSKKMSEEIVRKANLNCIWTIVRPTNVWGPWHMRYPEQLWKYMDRGLYFHPTKKIVVRSYAYVKNLNHQLLNILNEGDSVVDKKTFYLGDLPIDSNIWLQEWIKQLRNGSLRHIPSAFMYLAAKVGDTLNKIGIKFPMYSVRYYNMLEDYIAPTNITVAQFGTYNNALSENIRETIDWLNSEGKNFFEYWKNKS